MPLVAPQSAAFTDWFSGSKVVTATGQPLLMFHGTIRWDNPERGTSIGNFNSFDRRATAKNLGRPSSMDQVGSWFSSDPGEKGAGMYGAASGAIYPVYLAIRHPLVTSFKDFLKRGQQADPNWVEKEERNGMTIRRPTGRWDAELLRAKLKAAGYDGLHFPASEHVDGGDHEVWVAFEPEQIKSALGNRGTFDQKSANITERMTAADIVESLIAL